MKRIFMSAAVILLATAAVQAQTDSTKGPRHEHRQMQQGGGFEQLNLSADQQTKLKAMRDDFKTQADALKAQTLTEDDRRTKMQDLHRRQKEQLDAILTPDQKQQMETWRAEHKGQLNDRKNGVGDSTWRKGKENRTRDGAHLKKELNLSTEQQAKLKEIRTGFKKEAETLRNDKALTKEQKHTKMQELRKDQQAQMKTVLTKEQQEKMQSLRKERKSPVTK